MSNINASKIDAIKQEAYDDLCLAQILTGNGKHEKPTPVTESGLSPDYDRLNAENKAFIDSMIEKLLKSQSDG